VLLFIPACQVWSDIRDFMNYYYNNDLIQRTYVIWLLSLLVVYCNNASAVLDGVPEAALVVGPYVIARVSTAIMQIGYSFFVCEHQFQMRTYAALIVITSCVWLTVIWIPVRAKVGVAFACIALEACSFLVAYHPGVRKRLGKEYGTAVNIEHDVDRLSAFTVICIGEFLLGIVYKAGTGITRHLGRAILVLMIAYCCCWFYFNGSGSNKAVHPLRRYPVTAFLWFYFHLPITGSLILAADAASEMVMSDVTTTQKHPSLSESSSSAVEAISSWMLGVSKEATASQEPETFYSLQFFLTGGICVALLSMTGLAWLEKCLDKPGDQSMTKFWRLVLRVPAAATILCISFAEINTTLLLGMIALILHVALIWETFGASPSKQVCAQVQEEIARHRQERESRMQSWRNSLETARRSKSNIVRSDSTVPQEVSIPPGLGTAVKLV
jgi:low temperature requirement protein LtrA